MPAFPTPDSDSAPVKYHPRPNQHPPGPPEGDGAAAPVVPVVVAPRVRRANSSGAGSIGGGCDDDGNDGSCGAVSLRGPGGVLVRAGEIFDGSRVRVRGEICWRAKK